MIDQPWKSMLSSTEMNGVQMPFRTLRVSTGCRPDAYANGSEEYALSPFEIWIADHLPERSA
jgi:hypothetical protein